jgi:hypothetical protein
VVIAVGHRVYLYGYGGNILAGGQGTQPVGLVPDFEGVKFAETEIVGHTWPFTRALGWFAPKQVVKHSTSIQIHYEIDRIIQDPGYIPLQKW